jgi:hypothetical protein
MTRAVEKRERRGGARWGDIIINSTISTVTVRSSSIIIITRQATHLRLHIITITTNINSSITITACSSIGADKVEVSGVVTHSVGLGAHRPRGWGVEGGRESSARRESTVTTSCRFGRGQGRHRMSISTKSMTVTITLRKIITTIIFGLSGGSEGSPALHTPTSHIHTHTSHIHTDRVQITSSRPRIDISITLCKHLFSLTCKQTHVYIQIDTDIQTYRHTDITYTEKNTHAFRHLASRPANSHRCR